MSILITDNSLFNVTILKKDNYKKKIDPNTPVLFVRTNTTTEGIPMILCVNDTHGNKITLGFTSEARIEEFLMYQKKMHKNHILPSNMVGYIEVKLITHFNNSPENTLILLDPPKELDILYIPD